MTVFAYSAFYLICALNIIWGVRKKKSNGLYAIALIVIFTLMTFNYKGPDINTYISAYKLIGGAPDLKNAFSLTYMDRGYVFLMFGANKAGLDFYGFRAILTIICLSLFVSTIRYYKVNPNFIIGLYMAYLFFFDTIQIRNCIAQFIVLFSTRYLFKKSGFSILKYIICIAIAGSIHVVACIYLSLLLVKLFNRQRAYRRLLIIMAIVFLSCAILRPLLPQILNLISKYINRGSSYLNNSSRFGYIVVMAFYLLSLNVLCLYRKKMLDIGVRMRINNIVKIKIVVGLFLFLCIIDGSFYRIFRNLFILDMIGMALLYGNFKKHTNPSNIVLLSQFVFVGGWLATDLIRNSEMNIIEYAIKYNLLYNNAIATNITQYIMVVTLCLLTIFALKMVFSNHKRHYKRLVKCSQS